MFQHRIENKILKIHGAALCAVGLIFVGLITLGRICGWGIFRFLKENQIASIGFFEAFLLASVLGLFLLSSSTLEKTKNWNYLAATIHLVLAVTNIIFWNFYEVVDGEIPGTIATIFHFVMIGVEGWAGNKNASRYK